MTIDEYFGKPRARDLDFYTVKELYEDLARLMKEDKGDRIVLVGVAHEALGDYVFLDRANSCHRGLQDVDNKVVYLGVFDPDEDEALAQRIFED